jgi:hypothetical protein
MTFAICPKSGTTSMLQIVHLLANQGVQREQNLAQSIPGIEAVADYFREMIVHKVATVYEKLDTDYGLTPDMLLSLVLDFDSGKESAVTVLRTCLGIIRRGVLVAAGSFPHEDRRLRTASTVTGA